MYILMAASIYEGDFWNNNINGYGVWERNGRGLYNFANGDSYEGEYLNGYAVYTYFIGDVFRGENKKNEKNGHGVYTFNDGEVYEGGYVKNLKHVKRVLKKTNGEIVNVEYKNYVLCVELWY